MLPFVLSSLVLLGLSALLFRRRQALKVRLLTLKGTEVSTLGELRQLVGQVAAEMGPGAYVERVALSGTIRCETPLDAPLSQRKCVYCKTQVSEHYEESSAATGNRGSYRKRQRRQRLLSRDVLQMPFYLEDASGRVRVYPADFTVEGIEVVSRFEPATDGLNRRSAYGRSKSRRLLGHHYREAILPVDSSVYVLGQLRDDGGELAVRWQADAPDVSASGLSAGIITHRSRAELIGKTEKAIRRRGIAATVLMAASLAVLVIGLHSVVVG